jgi:hypothetical protein
MTAQIWRPSQASHKSNGAWVSIDRYGGVYLTCLHPQCLKRGHCNRRLLGQAPLSLLAQLNDSGASQAPGQDEAGCEHTTLLSGLADAVQQPSSGHKHRKESTRRQASSPENPPASLTEDYGLTTLAGADEEPDTTAILSDTPSVQRLRKLTREQSIKRVEIENQQSKKEPFQPWTVESGPWGGRSIAPQTGNQDLKMPNQAKLRSRPYKNGWIAQRHHRSRNTHRTRCSVQSKTSWSRIMHIMQKGMYKRC